MRDKNKLIAQTFYTFFVNGLMALMIGSVMPFIIEDYHIGYEIAGIFISLHSMGNLFASFVVGYGIYRFGRKKAVVVLSSLIALSFTGIILTHSVPLLYILFFLTGLGRGSVSNVNNGIINDIAVGKSSMLNLLHTFFAVGAFLTPIIASIITGNGYSWKLVVGLGILFAISMVMMYILMNMNVIGDNDGEKDEDSENVEVVQSFYKNIDFYIAGLLLFFYLGAENSVNGWVVTYLKDTGIMSVSFAQRLLSLLWIVIIVGRLCTALLSRILKNYTLILINSIGAAIFFIILMINTNAVIITASIVCFGFFLGGIYPTTISSVGNIIKGSSAGMATLLAMSGIGGILMPGITGVVAKRIGIAGGMSLIIVDILIMLLFAIIIKLRGNTKQIN